MEPGEPSWSPAQVRLSGPSPPENGGLGKRQHAQIQLLSAFCMWADGEKGALVLRRASSCTDLTLDHLWTAEATVTPEGTVSSGRGTQKVHKPGFPEVCFMAPLFTK